MKHTQWAAYPEALTAHAPVLIEVYSDVNGWRVGIDGRQVLAVDKPLDSAAAVAPVVQQETTRLSGRVVCHLADFRIWTPAGGTADWPEPSE